MAAPVITPASIVTYSGTGPLDFNIPISAAQSGRLLVLCNLAKDSTAVVNIISALAFDTAGVNATLVGGEIALQGVTSIAQEGIRSSQNGVYFIKDADLPSSAGSYLFEPDFDGDIDRHLWICFEILGCPDEGYDNLVQNISITDVAAAAKFSASITPVDNDCLIVDIWAISHSNAPTFTSTETQLAAIEDQSNAGGVVSQFTQIIAAAKTMEQESSTLHQRRAWTLLSFSGVASEIALDTSIAVVLDDTVASSVIETEQRINLDIALSDTTVNIQASLEADATISVSLDDIVVSLLASLEQGVGLELILENSITSISSNVEDDIDLNLTLDDTITNIVVSKEEAVILELVLENTIASILTILENDIDFNIVLADTITNIQASQQAGVNLELLLEATTTAIQAQNILNVSGSITLDDTVASIQVGLGGAGSIALNTILEDTTVSINSETEIGINLSLILENTSTNIIVSQELDLNLSLTLEDSQVGIFVSGVVLTGGSFTKIVSGSSVFTKIVKGSGSFIKEVAA